MVMVGRAFGNPRLEPNYSGLRHLPHSWKEASLTSNPGGLLWRHDRQEMPKGKSTDLAAAVTEAGAPLVLMDIAHLDHVAGTAIAGTERGNDPFWIGVEGLLA
jgi:hypothetical protein